MTEGIFTGRGLRDVAWDEPDEKKRARAVRGARRIVNGRDGSDAEVAAMHNAYVEALLAAGYAPIVEKPRKAEPEERAPVYDPEPDLVAVRKSQGDPTALREMREATTRLRTEQTTIAQEAARIGTDVEMVRDKGPPPAAKRSIWAVIAEALVAIFSRRT